MARLVTATLGLVGFAGLVTRCCVCASARATSASDARHSAARCASAAVWLVYAVALLASDVPLALAAQAASVVFFAAVVAQRLDLSWLAACAAVGCAYGLQNVAQWHAGEEPHSEDDTLFLENCFYLLPVALRSATAAQRCVMATLPVFLWSWSNLAIDSDSGWGLPFACKKKRLLVGKFQQEQEVKDLAACRAWCVAQNPHESTTSHWWVRDLDEPTRLAFTRLVSSQTIKALFGAKFAPKGYWFEPAHAMNELYVSAPTRRLESSKNSDDVFFTEHVDGPYCLFPFASLYRCIVALDENVPGYETHFPNAHQSVAARSGDVLAFDFHRESHYITMAKGGADRAEAREVLARDPTQKWRMVLKLHYAVSPIPMWWCCGAPLKWLSEQYNVAFRALFLATIAPQSRFAKFSASVGVNGTTVAYNLVEKHVGFGNFLFYAAVAAAAYAADNYFVFLYATQYLHYLRYVATYYDRNNVAFGTFKRDVLLFKTLALLQLGRLYLAPLFSQQDALCSVDDPCLRWDSLLLIAAGYFVSISATVALGVDGTYFGIELGVVEADYKFVNAFPYNVFPHPMILGQVAALAGAHLAPQLRARHPFLVPVHVLLYLAHLAQEAWDVHKGVPWYRKPKEA